jgi:hypothetical protein
MKPLDLSGNALALALRVPASRISAIIRAWKLRLPLKVVAVGLGAKTK